MIPTRHSKGNATRDAYISVLIVAKPDRNRHSLKFLLESKPEIKVVGQASESSLATELVHKHHPAVMILDTNLSLTGAWLTVLKQVKAESPQTRCLVLVDTQQALQVAKTTGADAALIKGFALANLFATIEGLLPL